MKMIYATLGVELEINIRTRRVVRMRLTGSAVEDTFTVYYEEDTYPITISNGRSRLYIEYNNVGLISKLTFNDANNNSIQQR